MGSGAPSARTHCAAERAKAVGRDGLSNCDAAEQGDEADEAKHIGASQLIPGVLRTIVGTRGGERVSNVVVWRFGGTSCCLSRLP